MTIALNFCKDGSAKRIITERITLKRFRRRKLKRKTRRRLVVIFREADVSTTEEDLVGEGN